MQLLYDCDGVRVVETQVSLCLQESFEVVPDWPEGQPVPHYLAPQPRGAIHWLLGHIREGLGLRETSPPPSAPDQKVQNIAKRVREHTAVSIAVEAIRQCLMQPAYVRVSYTDIVSS